VLPRLSWAGLVCRLPASAGRRGRRPAGMSTR